MILSGSRAIKHHFEDFYREPRDFDYIAFPPYDENFVARCERTDDGRRVEIMMINIFTTLYKPGDVLSPDHIYTLKISHIFWPVKQMKHISDINFLRSKGCKLDLPLFEYLYDHWAMVHGPNVRTNFDKTNDEFFDDFVTRKYNHDDLHLMMNPTPLYQLAKEDLSYADISKDKFFALTRETQMELIREEAYVLALERYMIPDGLQRVHWRVAYANCLRAMIRRLTPLWLGLFIVENFSELNKPTFDYYKKFKQHGKNEL